MISIPTIFTSLIVAVLTSVLSVHLALKRYRTEKWWDRKSECYVRTINAMNDMLHFCDASLSEALGGKALTEEQRQEFHKKFIEAKQILESQVNIGQLLMSNDALEDLLLLESALFVSERQQDFVKEIAEIRGTVESCLASFIPKAKGDLGVGK